MNNEYTLGELAKKETGLENETLAILTFEYCNNMYPLEAFKPVVNCIKRFNAYNVHIRYKATDISILQERITAESFRDALHNDKDPDLTEIQEFCAPMKNLEFKFSKFENLVKSEILDCEVTGNKDGAYIVQLSFKTNKPEEKNALFMKKFNPEDFNQEDK